jgi:hypothetical protein
MIKILLFFLKFPLKRYSETLEFNAYRIEPNRIESKTRKNFLILKVLELSELFEPNRNQSNRW